jgi:hypothetical protein
MSKALFARRLAAAGLAPLALAAGLMVAGSARAANFDFLAAPEIELNRVYRLDKLTGEIGACQYGDKEGTIGVTLCYPPGEGAKGQPPSTYALVASRHEREGGVFRVDVRTGVMSICYVLKAEVVCTPPAK